MDDTMRAVLAPALEQFKRLAAWKRSRGATEEDILRSLDEMEASMHQMGLMSSAQLKESMQLYHEALEKEAERSDARKQADAILGTLCDAVRVGITEERGKGTSEADVHQKIKDICAMVEKEHRGKMPDPVVDEMVLMIREAAAGELS